MNFLVKSNIFVAICTASLAFQSFILNGAEVDANLLFIVFLSTLFIYCFHRFVKTSNNRNKSIQESFFLNKKIITIIGGIAGLLLFPFLYFMSFESKIFFSIAGLLTLWYTIGIIKRKEKRLTLRAVPYLKLFLIAGIWTLMTVSFPLLEFNFKGNYWLIFTERFLFVLAITIPFDIRDMEADKIEGIKTFPILLGIKTMKMWSIFIISLFMLVSVYGYLNGMHNTGVTLALLLSAAITIFLLRKVNADNPPFFYSLGMEGMSLLQTILVVLVTML